MCPQEPMVHQQRKPPRSWNTKGDFCQDGSYRFNFATSYLRVSILWWFSSNIFQISQGTVSFTFRCVLRSLWFTSSTPIKYRLLQYKSRLLPRWIINHIVLILPPATYELVFFEGFPVIFSKLAKALSRSLLDVSSGAYGSPAVRPSSTGCYNTKADFCQDG